MKKIVLLPICLFFIGSTMDISAMKPMESIVQTCKKPAYVAWCAKCAGAVTLIGAAEFGIGYCCSNVKLEQKECVTLAKIYTMLGWGQGPKYSYKDSVDFLGYCGNCGMCCMNQGVKTCAAGIPCCCAVP